MSSKEFTSRVNEVKLEANEPYENFLKNPKTTEADFDQNCLEISKFYLACLSDGSANDCSVSEKIVNLTPHRFKHE